MPKPPQKHEPDPMSQVVDRLLAQLPGLHEAPRPYSAPKSFSNNPARSVRASNRFEAPSIAGLWCRVGLGITLGIMMLGWPYFRGCGLPLFGYLFATVILIGSGWWTAVIGWKLRNAPAHIVSLLLLFWGIVLASGEILPRNGYAAVPATWQCGEPGSGPAWMRWFAVSEG